MRLAIVVTTINPPNEQWLRMWGDIARRAEGTLIIIGDQKTDVIWEDIPSSSLFAYISPHEQMRRWPELAGSIPWNHYARKMLGYLYAKEIGCTHIFETDDDNYPIEPFLDTICFDRKKCDEATGAVFNHYLWFDKEYECLWPRGLDPRWSLNGLEGNAVFRGLGPSLKPLVTQFLHDNDPDFDAVGRMNQQGKPKYWMRDKPAVALVRGCWSVFNSQATLWDLSLLAWMYLPCTCTHRFTDILRSWWMLESIWEVGATVCFAGPTVIQQRNEHDLQEDLRQEVPMYRTAEWARCFFCKRDESLMHRMQRSLSWGIISEYEQQIWQAWTRAYESVSSVAGASVVS